MTARTSRTYTLLLGIPAAGALIWLAARVGEASTWRYWAVLGLLAGAGLAFALAQRTAYGAWAEVTPLGFLVAFAIGAICVLWIAVAGQPTANWFREHVSSWSGDLGIGGFVDATTTYTSVMAFGLGALLASAPGAVRRPAPAPAPAPGPAPAAYRRPVPADGDGTVDRGREHVREHVPV
jgi:hypothetical protein